MENYTFISSLTNNQIKQAITLSHSTWGSEIPFEDLCNKIIERREIFSPSVFDMAGITINNELACSLKKYFFNLSINNKAVPCVGFGAVFTNPKFRKKGLAKLLIESVLEEAQGQGVESSLLYSDIGAIYYEKLGYKTFPTSSWEIQIDSTIAPLSLGPDSSLASPEELIKLYERKLKSSGLWILRDKTNWDLCHHFADISHAYSFSKQGRLHGYMLFSVDKKKNILNIEDFFCVESEENYYNFALNLAKNLGLNSLTQWHNPKQYLPKNAKPKDRVEQIPMIKLLNHKHSLNNIKDDFFFSGLNHY